MPKNLNANRNETIQNKPLDAQALRQLLDDPRTEVTEEELNHILESELDKPDSEIDLKLLEELLAALEPASADSETIEAGRKRLVRELQARKKRGPLVYLRRAVIAAAAIIVLFFVALGSARAMRWTFLLKYLEPIAQTFGIYIGNRTEAPVQLSVYSSDLEENAQIMYSSEAEIPSFFDDYPIRLAHVPERFEFVYGMLYNAPDVKTFNILYQGNNDEWLNYTVYVFPTEEAAVGFSYEKREDQAQTIYIGAKEVTLYLNSDDPRLSISWIDRNAHYSLVGYITLDESTEILNGIE